MNNLKRTVFFILALQICFAATASAKWNRGRVIIMTYNIKAGAGLDDVRDYARSARIVSRVLPDVCALQEVDSVTRRSGGVDGVDLMARRAQMYGNFAHAIKHDGGSYGVGLLSVREPSVVFHVALPGREEKRVVLVADYGGYIVMSTHLSLTEADQLTSIEILASLAEEVGDGKPVFVAGDLNFTPDSNSYRLMSKRFTLLSDAWQSTFPADEPTECLDYVWAYKAKRMKYKTIRSEVIDASVESDHRPVVVEVEYACRERSAFGAGLIIGIGLGGLIFQDATTIPVE